MVLPIISSLVFASLVSSNWSTTKIFFFFAFYNHSSLFSILHSTFLCFHFIAFSCTILFYLSKLIPSAYSLCVKNNNLALTSFLRHFLYIFFCIHIFPLINQILAIHFHFFLICKHLVLIWPFFIIDINNVTLPTKAAFPALGRVVSLTTAFIPSNGYSNLTLT